MSQEIITQGESTGVVTRSASPFDGNVAEFKGTLERRGENRKSLIDWIHNSLVEGTDYGRIHTKKKSECQHRGPPACTYEKEPRHWSKNTLFKPGAEKICGMLGVVPTFPAIKDYEQAALNGVPVESIILRCHLLSANGDVLADGVGARNVAQDYGNLNTSLKMALKSAHIDATLRMAGLSELFTQDLDDMKDKDTGGDAPDQHRKTSDTAGAASGDAAPTPQRAQHDTSASMPPQQAPTGSHRRGFASDKQVKLIMWRCEEAGLNVIDVLREFKFVSVNDITWQQVNPILAFIGDHAQ